MVSMKIPAASSEGRYPMPSSQSPRPVAPYPLFIYLQGQPVSVIGGGHVAERKTQTLLSHGARVTLTAPSVTDALRALADAGRIVWRERCYCVGDLADTLLVIGATDNRVVNEAVYDEACRRHILVNIVDVPDLCTAIVPSIMQRGRLQIAVSTQGAAPSEARDIRRGLEREFPEWWEPYLDLMAEIRLLVKQRVPGPASARTPLYAAVGASGLKERIARGELPSAEDVYAEVVAPLLEGGAQ